jgi:hypothetical protein
MRARRGAGRLPGVSKTKRPKACRTAKSRKRLTKQQRKACLKRKRPPTPPKKRRPTHSAPTQNTHSPAPLPGPDPGSAVVPDPGGPVVAVSAPSTSAGGGGGGAANPGPGTGGGTTTTPPPDDAIIPRYTGPFGAEQAQRLLWRAGFGPRPGQIAQLVALGLDGAVRSLTRVTGEAPLDGPEPVDHDGLPLRPAEVYNHDQAYWQDRMARSRHSLVERMALIWHDWFATKAIVVQSQRLMLEQTQLFRTHALGSFADLLWGVTTGGAMLLFLNGVENRAGAVNENYGREMMELFALGPDRGAYTEHDVKEIARALSGWTSDYDPQQGPIDFRFDPDRHDAGTKTIFGQTGAFTPRDAVDLVLAHPLHASFVVRKLWSSFVAEPPPAAVAAALEREYVANGHRIGPLVEAILTSRQLYEGDPLVKPPAVFVASSRATSRTGRRRRWRAA